MFFQTVTGENLFNLSVRNKHSHTRVRETHTHTLVWDKHLGSCLELFQTIFFPVLFLLSDAVMAQLHCLSPLQSNAVMVLLILKIQ